MPVRFKDTAEYHQRFSPHATQTVPKNSNKATDLPSGSQPLVSILKTSVLPTDIHRGRGSHLDEYVLLGDQSKFAPSIKYRLRPTAFQQTTPHQPCADSSAASLQRTEDAEVRGHSSSQRHSDVEGSLVIGQGINKRRSQGFQSNAGDMEVASRDKKTKKKLIPLEENHLSGKIIVDKEKVKDQGYHLGQTYNITQSQLQSRKIRSSSKERQQQPLESHQHHQHHHQRDDDKQMISKRNHSQLHQATQTNESSHHRSINREKSDEESRRKRRIEAKDPQWWQNKENTHSRLAEDQPISREDYNHRRNSNNNSCSATTQKRMLSYHDEKRREKSEGQRDASAERHRIRDRGRETETERQRDPSAERHRDRGKKTETERQRDPSGERQRVRDRGRETEAEGHREPFAESQRARDKGRETETKRYRDPSAERQRDRGRDIETEGHRDPSAERHKARGEERRRRETEPQSLRDRAENQNNDNRTQNSTKEIKPNKDSPGIFMTSGSSAFTSYAHRHHPHRQQQQQHLLSKKMTSRDQFPSAEHAKNILQSTSKTLVQEKKRDGKTSSEDRFLSQKRNSNRRSVTEARSSLHDSSSQDKSTSTGDDRRSTAQSRILPGKAAATQRMDRLRSKGHSDSSCFSKAESDSRASVTKKDEIIQTGLPTTEVQRMNMTRTRENEFPQQPKSLPASPLRNDSEYQRQFRWRRPASEAFVQQQQQQQQQPPTQLHRRSAISLSHPDFLTLFASDSADKEEDTEYRFQFRPISARNDRKTDRGNLAQQLNQLRRGHSLRDLSTGERSEETNKTNTSVVVKHRDGKPRNYRSEYMRNFQPPWNYEYEDGTWKDLEEERRNISQVQADDVTEVDQSLVRSSSSASSWYEEVLQLRRHAEEYRKRSHGTHFSREQLEQLYARNLDLRDAAVSSALSQNDSRRRNASSATSDLSVGRELRQAGEWRMEDERTRRREDGRREERTMDEGSSGRPLRHHFDRASHQHRNHLKKRQTIAASSLEDAYDDSELSSGTEAGDKSLRHVTLETKFQGRESGEDGRRRRPVDRVSAESRRNEDRWTDLSDLSSTEDFRSADRKLLEQSTQSALSEAMRDNRRKKTAAANDSVSREDKSVQINFDAGTAFKSNRQKIISSSSLASQVLERARNRNDKFWSK